MDRWTYALFFFLTFIWNVLSRFKWTEAELYLQWEYNKAFNFYYFDKIDFKYRLSANNFQSMTTRGFNLNEIKFKSSFWLLISDNWIDSWKSLTEWCVFLTENVEASSLEGHVVGGYDVPVRGQV